MAKIKFYSLDNIKKKDADYNVIYGERSNGKTTAVLAEGVKLFVDSGYKKQIAIIRRYEEDFRGKNGQQMLENIVKLGWVEKWTKGEYNDIYYYSKRWFFCKYDENGKKVAQMETPCAMGFAISSEEHYKSTSYPDIDIILFDEFISRTGYLTDEFVKYQSLLSTIIRLRDNVKIYMCGNTINKFCPYFNEMGLSNIKNQLRGTIDVYTYGDSGLTVAVEYSDFDTKAKKSNKYFAFNNPKLKMITHGGWEIDIYPHLPTKYKPNDVLYKFFIDFDGILLQGNIILVDDEMFIYIHRKTTPIKEDNECIVFQQQPSHKLNVSDNILKPNTKLHKRILDLFKINKVFYQDNEIGEVVRNYMMWCGKK